MKVIFNEHVLHVWKKGEVKEVSSWYASNFLFPKNLAQPYTKNIENNIQASEQKKEAERRILLWNKQELVDTLSWKEFPFTLKWTESKVYGSILPKDIAEYVSKKYRIPVTKKHVDLWGVHSSLKSLWKHDIYVNFGENYAAKAIVNISLEK